jgi:TonB-linked SusC/RagA family outer membrane protein
MKNTLNYTMEDGRQRSLLLPMLLFVLFLLAMPWTSFSQTTGTQTTGKITGVILDANGETMPGVTVMVLGTTAATQTDGNGVFSVTGTEGRDLKISCVGFLTKTIKATSTFMRIVLSEETKYLKEVVAIGYGAVKRENLLGAVSSMTGKEIEDIPAGNLSQAIVGKLASVHVSETTGRPGSTTPLTIRSAGSFSTGSDVPIFVIDGIVRDQDWFDMLDPSQVESLSVLKDGAAAVYGARGAGGAVLVTMKRGKEGKARVSYSGQYGFTTPTRFPTMLSASEQATLLNIDTYNSDLYTEADYDDYPNLYTADEIAAMQNVKYDWLDAVWQNSQQLRNTIGISGGSDKVRYYAGGSMWNETGNFKNIDVKKYSLRTSLDADLSDEITASMELSLNNNDEKFPYLVGDNEENMNGFYKTLLTTSYWIPYKVGDRYVNLGNDTSNPLAILDSDCYKSSLSISTAINASLSYKPKSIPGLTASVRFGYTLSNDASRQYVSPYQVWTYGRTGTHNHLYDVTNPISSSWKNTGDNERLTLAYGKSTSYQLNTGLSYVRSFGKHNVSGFFSYEQSENSNDGISMRYINQLIPNKEVINAYNAFDIASSTLTNSGRIGFVGRLNYDFAGKYLLETSFREEASVKFAPGHRWGFFPQLALGWRLSEEDFFADLLPYINYLKIRGSAGLLGQDNGVGDYEYQLNYTLMTSYGQYFGTGNDDAVARGIEPQNNGIQTIGVTWEKTRSYDVGIDTKFLNGMFDFTIDGYYRHTWDIFDNVSSVFSKLVGTEGSGIPKINYGIVDSWGIDFELGYNGKIDKNSDYYIKANYSWGDNIVLRKYESDRYTGTWASAVGRSTNQGEQGYNVTGMFRTQEQVDAYMQLHPGMTFFGETPQVGMLIYEDIARAGAANELYYVAEPDGIVDEFDLNWIGGKSGPIHAVNLSLGYSYKTFRADMTLTGGFGGTSIVNKTERVGPTATSNVPSYWNDSWTYANPNAAYPSVAYGSGVLDKASTFWLRSSNILRLRTVNLSYTLPKEMTVKLGIPSLRVFLTGTNLLTLISDFQYKDANLARFYDYPLLRSFNLGLNISL